MGLWVPTRVVELGNFSADGFGHFCFCDELVLGVVFVVADVLVFVMWLIVVFGRV